MKHTIKEPSEEVFDAGEHEQPFGYDMLEANDNYYERDLAILAGSFEDE